jgi:hypothetical protein
MSTDDNTKFAKLMEDYQKMLKMFREHLKKCSSFKKKVLEEFELDA